MRENEKLSACTFNRRNKDLSYQFFGGDLKPLCQQKEFFFSKLDFFIYFSMNTIFFRVWLLRSFALWFFRRILWKRGKNKKKSEVLTNELTKKREHDKLHKYRIVSREKKEEVWNAIATQYNMFMAVQQKIK